MKRTKYAIQLRSANGGKWRTIDTASDRSMARSSVKGLSALVNLNHGDIIRSRSEGDTHILAVFSDRKGVVVIKQTTAYTLDHVWDGDEGAQEQLYVVNSFLGRSVAVECAILIARRIVNRISKTYRQEYVDCLNMAYEYAVNRTSQLVDLLYAIGERMNDAYAVSNRSINAFRAISFIAASSDPDADELFSDDLISSIDYMEEFLSQRTMCGIISERVPLSYLLLKIVKG